MLAEEKTRLDEINARVVDHDESLREARNAVSTRHRAQQEAQFAVRECASRLEDIARNEVLAREQLEKGIEELARLEGEHGELDESALQLALKTALDLRYAREAALAQRRDELESANRDLKALEDTRLRLEHEMDPLRERIGDLKLKLQGADLVRAQSLERLEELGIEASVLSAAEMQEVRENALNRDVVRLTRELADLGAVNLAALQELDTATERKHFLDVQFEDLTRAIETLQDAIRRIDRDTREQLMTTYDAVNKHFGELFPRLFGGGEAQLVLSGRGNSGRRRADRCPSARQEKRVNSSALGRGKSIDGDRTGVSPCFS